MELTRDHDTVGFLRGQGQLIVAAAAAWLVLGAATSQATAATWLKDADGYERALKRSARTGQPVLMFVYTDWCPYCRRMNDQLLSKQVVRSYLRGILEVRLNPEHGPKERAIASRHGVTGYPTLFMFPPGEHRPKKLNAYTKRGGQWVLMRPAEFVELCKQTGGEPPTARTTSSRNSRAAKVASASPGVQPAPSLPSVTVRLRDGTTVQGVLVDETSEAILLELETGRTVYPRDLIERVIPDAPAE